MKFAGCNYHINQGNNEHEPVGTAQSMHDCVGCNIDGACILQKDTETWAYTSEHEKLTDEWLNTQRHNGR